MDAKDNAELRAEMMSAERYIVHMQDLVERLRREAGLGNAPTAMPFKFQAACKPAPEAVAVLEKPAPQRAEVVSTAEADRMVWRNELQQRWCSETIRRWIKAGKLPKPDVMLSKKTVGWRLSTLHAHGVVLA